MKIVLSMPVCQERLRVVLGSVALKPSYLARITSLGDYSDLVERWDNGLKEVLQSVMPGMPISDRAWMIACLPTALGGLGVLALADFADAAFVASFLGRPSTSQLRLRLRVSSLGLRWLAPL